MIGKRVIKMKRPAVLCAAAFVAGIALAGSFTGQGDGGFDGNVPWDAGWVLIGIAGGFLIGCVSYLRKLSTGGRRVSVADRLLLLVPVFLLAGFGVMKWNLETYETKVHTFAECMKNGRDLLVKGTVSQIRWSKNGIQLELRDALAASYAEEETLYRPVGTLLIYAEGLPAENGELKHGQKILVYGKGSIFEEASNPGGFDAKAYYFSLGITGAIQGKSLRITEKSYHRLNQALFQAKNKLLNSYITYLGEEGAGVIASMLLGERALLSDETKALYRHGGISHILAISGLHVSLIGMALYNVLRKSVLGRNGAIPAACIGVVLYGTFVEAGTSTKRAVIMFLLLLLATALGRTYDTLSAMSVSMIVILWGSPGALYTASFQLSYAAAYGASVMAVLLREKEKERSPEERAVYTAKWKENRWFRFRERIIGKMKSMVVFGLAVQAVTFPFTVYHFFEYPAYGFFLNPVVVPLMTILLLCGLLSGVCGLFVPWLGYFFAGGTGGILWIYDTLCRLTEGLPGALLLFGQPSLWQIGIYFAVLAFCVWIWQGRGGTKIKRDFSEDNRRRERVKFLGRKVAETVWERLEKQAVFFGVLFVLPVCLFQLPGAKFEVSFLDVDQGDGIVLRERNGAVFLVDGGSTGVQNVGEKRIIPYLKSQGIRVIDCAFVSHGDTDHISGIREILEKMPVYSSYRERIIGYTGTPVIKRIALPEGYEPDALLEAAKEKNVEIVSLQRGDRLKAGEKLTFSCLAPEPGVVYEDRNAASMVLLASYGVFDILLTGDMDKAGEERLTEQGMFGDSSGRTGSSDEEVFVEVLKVAHHGSYTASSKEFIMALSPQISVISCGKDNRYGHPHTETLETLYEANSRVYRTDESGCVTVKVGKERIDVEVFNE